MDQDRPDERIAEAVSYIESIPMFAKKNGAEHTGHLLDLLGNPEKDLRIIHVAGTNGKGSVSAYIDSMLRRGGGVCCLFTSPHLFRLNERFLINGNPVCDRLFADAFEQVKRAVDRAVSEGEPHPAYFEWLFLMAMVIFRRERADWCVLETGMGGRLDATNVIRNPLCTVITSIGLDHTRYLGHTIAEIAAEKAGILKEGVPVVYDADQEEANRSILAAAGRHRCPVYPVGSDRIGGLRFADGGISFRFRPERGRPVTLKIRTIADYQVKNAAIAWQVMQTLKDTHRIGDAELRRGLCLTQWPCRMEKVHPHLIIDGAHNPDGIRAFCRTVRRIRGNMPAVILYSAVADHDYRAAVHILAQEAGAEAVVVTEIAGGRRIPAEELAELFRNEGASDVTAEPDPEKACSLAIRKASDGMAFCVGSLYLAGKIRQILKPGRVFGKPEY